MSALRVMLLVFLVLAGCDASPRAQQVFKDTEICDDGIDNDQDGDVDCGDRDCIGSCDEACGDLIDNDGDALVDCFDDDCDGHCPEVCSDNRDNDGDGKIDCDDSDCRTCEREVCNDGWDNDGDLLADCADPDCYTTCDSDSDGYLARNKGGDDCDDTDPNVHPGAPELCNTIDDDCDNAIDDDDDDTVGFASFYDGDGDGYGDPSAGTCRASGPKLVPNSDDCNDGEALVKPGADEICNGIDDDCDNFIDDADPGTTDRCDVDGDGHTAVTRGGDDCDDTDAAIGPQASEICDGIDNDCDGIIDSGDPDLVGAVDFADIDGDGYGDPANQRCEAGANTVLDRTDCADNDASINPGADEVCNGDDDDCDGEIDDNDPGLRNPPAWYVDADRDGYGDANQPAVYQCIKPTGDYATRIDCDDTDASIGGPNEWYTDSDNDGATLASPTLVDCNISPPPNLVARSVHVDCDDNDASITPGRAEDCSNNLDDDCDGIIDCPCTEIVVGLLYGGAWTDPDLAPLNYAEMVWSDPTVFSTNGDCPVRFVELQPDLVPGTTPDPLDLTEIGTLGVTTIHVPSPGASLVEYEAATMSVLGDWFDQGGGITSSFRLVHRGAVDNSAIGQWVGVDPACLEGGTTGSSQYIDVIESHPVTWGQLTAPQQLLSLNSTQDSCNGDWRNGALLPGAQLIALDAQVGYAHNTIVAYEDAGRGVFFSGHVERNATAAGQQALYDAWYWTSGWR